MINGDKGFAAVPTIVWHTLGGPLGLFCLLSYRGDNKTGRSWWSHDAMANDLNVSRDTIKRWLKVLVDAGFVTVEKRVTDLGQTSNLYTVIGVFSGSADLHHPGSAEMHYEIQTTITSTTEELDKDKNNVSDRFDEFWKVYPHKINKAPARKAWAKAVKKVGADHLIERVTAFANDPNLPDKQFICHASTWLNQERWDNEAFPARDNRIRVVSDTEQRGREQLREIYQQIREQEGNTDEAK